MPIVVEGPDGSRVEFPDGTSKQVMQRAMADKFGGPKNRPAPAPTTRQKGPSPLDKFANVGKLSDVVLSAKSGRKQATTAKERGYQKAKVLDETTRKKSLLSKIPVVSDVMDATGGYLDAQTAAAGRSMFNIPNVIAAAVKTPFGDQSFSENLDELNGATEYQTDKSAAGNVIGTLYGSLQGANAGQAAVRGLGGKLVTSGAAPALGRVIAGAATARKGQNVRNLVKLSAGGAAGGGAQMLSENEDPLTGAAIGAAAGPVMVGLGKGLRAITRPVADVMGLPGAGTILKRFTNASREEIEANAQRFRDETGAEPTLFEILPLADRNKLAKEVIGRTPDASSRAADAVRRRVGNMGTELQRSTRQATGEGRQRVIQQMTRDLEDARAAGGVPPVTDRGMLPAGPGADRSPMDLKNFQQTEANARMASTGQTQAADDVESLFPRSLQRNDETGEIEEVFSDREVNDAILNASGLFRRRATAGDAAANISGLTADDMTRILKNLQKVPGGAPNKGAAMRAEAHIMDEIERQNPAAAQAIAGMRENWSRRARMIEGMAEGGRTRTRESIPVETSDQARTLRNAYDTPEGTGGRFVGQANATERQFGGTTSDTFRAADNIAQSGETQAALRQNLGENPTEAIRTAADAQMRSARALASLDKETGKAADSLGTEDLGRIILALNPASMPTTKLFALSRLTSLTRLPEGRAREIVDLLFSQNPRVTNEAIAMLRRAGPEVENALGVIARGIADGNLAAQATSGMDESLGNYGEAQAREITPEETGEVEGQEPQQEFGSYDEVLNDWEANEDPELVRLIDAQFNQESRNQQFDENGNPLQSSAGAIGIAQVMPNTAPEAANLAGLPWDEEAYYSDPAYNKLLGIAYMKEMLRRYDGDVAMALAAYNAGPGAVDAAGGIPSIAETENYVDSILARR